jgi:hypothetical protein
VLVRSSWLNASIHLPQTTVERRRLADGNAGRGPALARVANVRGEKAMPLDYRSELKRPMSLVLAGAAILGWLVAFSIWFSSSNRLQEAQTERARVQQAEVALRGELDEQRRTSGALAGLQTRVTDAQRQLTELTRSREEAQSRAAAVQQELQTGEQRARAQSHHCNPVPARL